MKHKSHSRHPGAFRKDRRVGHKKAFRPHEKPVAAKPSRPEAPRPAREGVLLWGQHAVATAWLNPKRRCLRLWVTEAGLASLGKTLEEGKQQLLKRPDLKRADRQTLDQLTPPGSVHQGMVLEAMPLHEPLLHEVISGEDAPDLVLVLDQVTDPHNIGAIARSASALQAGAIIMTERNAPGQTGVLAKSASGAIEHIPLIHVVNLARTLEELQKNNYWCVGLAEEGSRDLGDCDLKGRTALVLGAEGEGLRQLTRKKCDELARLPTCGPIASLNVSNAAAIALYEVRRQKSIK